MKFCYKDHSKSSLCAACPRTDISPSCGVLYCNKVQVVQDCVQCSIYISYMYSSCLYRYIMIGYHWKRMLVYFYIWRMFYMQWNVYFNLIPPRVLNPSFFFSFFFIHPFEKWDVLCENLRTARCFRSLSQTVFIRSSWNLVTMGKGIISCPRSYNLDSFNESISTFSSSDFFIELKACVSIFTIESAV